MNTRSDYVLVKPVLQTLRDRYRLSPTVLGCGAARAAIRQAAETDGFAAETPGESALLAKTAAASCSALGLGLIHAGAALERLVPDLLVLSGPLRPSFAVLVAAQYHALPTAWLRPCEPECDRPGKGLDGAAQSLVSLHLTPTADDRERLLAAGGDPGRVHHVGSLEVARILGFQPIGRETVLRRLGLPASARFVLVIVQAKLSDAEPDKGRIAALFAALDDQTDLVKVVVGGPAEAGDATVVATVRQVAMNRPDYRLLQGLGAKLFASAARYAEAVVSDDWTDVATIPSLAVPLVYFGPDGDRCGAAESVIACVPDREGLTRALARALSLGERARAARADNPYEKAGTVAAVAALLAEGPLVDAVAPTERVGLGDGFAHAASGPG